MTRDRDIRAHAAGEERPCRQAGNAPPRRRERTVAWQLWLLFHSACVAASLALAWFGPVVPLPALLRGGGFLVAVFLIPLAVVLVPALLLRHVRHRRTPKLAATALSVALVAAVVMAVVTEAAGDERALQKRGRWTEAVVVEVRNRKTDMCTLRSTRDGREISPELSEGNGCEAESVDPGDTMRVLYDPEGAAGPEDADVDLAPGAYREIVAALAALIIATGTWGCARLGRGENGR